MSEIVVIGFRDSHRGLQVLSELWRLSEGLARDLDTALVLSWESRGKLIVRQSVNLSTGEGVRWGRLWGALIRITLPGLHTDEMSAAAGAVTSAAGAPSREGCANNSSQLDAGCWVEQIGLSPEFLRDIGALIQPGDSAIFALLRKQNHQQVARLLPNYGGTLLHTTLDAAQEAKLRDFLTCPDGKPVG
jgi:uncharacterized membrane protein